MNTFKVFNTYPKVLQGGWGVRLGPEKGFHGDELSSHAPVNFSWWFPTWSRHQNNVEGVLKGFIRGVPKVYHCGIWIILSLRQSRPCGLTRNFYLSLKEFNFGDLPIIRVIIRNNFF